MNTFQIFIVYFITIKYFDFDSLRKKQWLSALEATELQENNNGK